MRITYYNSQSLLKISKLQVENLIKLVLEFKKVTCSGVVCHFVTKEEISHVHKDFFDDPTPTDCISFPIDSKEEPDTPHSILGEVFVCPEIAIEYSETHNKNPYEETSLYLIHGLLHLLGYDDLTADEKKVMRKEEKKCISYVEQNGAILSPT